MYIDIFITMDYDVFFHTGIVSTLKVIKTHIWYWVKKGAMGHLMPNISLFYFLWRERSVADRRCDKSFINFLNGQDFDHEKVHKLNTFYIWKIIIQKGHAV